MNDPRIDVSARDPSTNGNVKLRLARLRHELWTNGHYVATESDRWFLLLVQGVHHGALWTRSEVGAFSNRLLAGPLELRRRLADRRRRARLFKLLCSEAKRARLDAPNDKVQRFARQMSALLDLVLSGQISIDDISFEQDDQSGH